MVIFVSIRSDIRIRPADIQRTISLSNANISKQIMLATVQLMRRLAPVHSGKFKNSIRAIPGNAGVASSDLTGVVGDRYSQTIIVAPTVRTATYTIHRTVGSPGRYVPAIMKRLSNKRFQRPTTGRQMNNLVGIIGWHPGTKAIPLINQTKKGIRFVANGLIRDEYGSLSVRLVRLIRK